jgi:hypothetical protein
MAFAFKVFKETALPGTLQPHSIYFIAPASAPSLVEIYVTNAAGSAARHVLGTADVQSMIDTSLAAFHELVIVPNIAGLSALLPLSSPKYAYVVDATTDPTVASGGATYLYNPANGGAWIKISEAESLDVQMNWASIVGKPTSSAAAIDAAVAASHTHANKTQLDKIGEDANGMMTYNGVLLHAGWDSSAW